MPKVIQYRTNGNRLSAKYRMLARSIKADTLEATRREMEKAKDKAVFYSSVSVYKIGRDIGYPYSVRDPHPPLPPYFLNVQSGRLRKSWFIRERVSASGAITFTLYNTAKYSGYMLGGTKRMIDRPILSKVFEEFDPRMTLKVLKKFRSKAAHPIVSDPIPNLGGFGIVLAAAGGIASGIIQGTEEASNGR